MISFKSFHLWYSGNAACSANSSLAFRDVSGIQRNAFPCELLMKTIFFLHSCCREYKASFTTSWAELAEISFAGCCARLVTVYSVKGLMFHDDLCPFYKSARNQHVLLCLAIPFTPSRIPLLIWSLNALSFAESCEHSDASGGRDALFAP
jgi:hypothetical protein